VADALAPQCNALVVTGRDWPGLLSLEDWPAPGLGPLGGLSAALRFATAQHWDAVLAAPCDLLGIPPDAAQRLSPGPAIAEGQWLLGLWPTDLAPALESHLASGRPRAVREFAAATAARSVPITGLSNINHPGDLAG
jgi:molybdopterin-guanine dinucleotide biosynthesis protein A